MSSHVWCHGTNCHKSRTQDRVRGSKGSKVLRTRKIKQDTEWLRQSVFSHFCNQRCLMDYIQTHIRSIIAIAPRREALETPIKVEKEKYESSRYNWNGEGRPERVPYMATRTKIIS